MSDHHIHVFDEWKRSPFGSRVLRGTMQDTPFSLLSVTYDCLNDQEIIRLLARWRKTHERWFPAIFPVTEEGTRAWLKERVLDVGDRILFLIRVDDRYIGHVGLFRYDPNQRSIDLDNIVRGEEGWKGIMQASLETLMQWARNVLLVHGFTLQTTSDNSKALALYHRLGFSETRRVPVVFQQTDDGGVWTETDDGPNISRYHVYMKKEVV